MPLLEKPIQQRLALKKAQEAWETKTNSICLAVGGKKL